MLTNKKVIILSFLFLFLATSFLVIKGENDNNFENYSFWEVYFEDIDSNNLDFFIADHLQKNNYSWEIFLDGEMSSQGQIQVEKNSRSLVDIDEESFPNWTRAVIKIYSPYDSKELIRVKK